MRSGKQQNTAFDRMLPILPQAFATEIKFRKLSLDTYINPFLVSILVFLRLQQISRGLNLSPASHMLGLTFGFYVCKMG